MKLLLHPALYPVPQRRTLSLGSGVRGYLTPPKLGGIGSHAKTN
ncbi:MAG: hypothetical protein WAU33_03340 [Candidatus Binataceae bacterium]